MPKRDFAKEQIWKEKLENCKSSGLTQAKWCRENDEKIHSFKYWHQRLKNHKVPKVRKILFLA